MDLADGAALKALATIVNPHHQHGIDIVALVKGLVDQDSTILELVLKTNELRPLFAYEAFSDSFLMDIIHHGEQVLSFQEFKDFWSRHCPVMQKIVSAKDRYGFEDIFKLMLDLYPQPEQKVENNEIVLLHLLKARKEEFAVRAMLSTLELADYVVASNTFKLLAKAMGDRGVDFDEFIKSIDLCVSIENHLKTVSVSLDPLMLVPIYSECLAQRWEIDILTEPYLLLIIKRALENPLPDNWTVCDGFYQNNSTGEESESHPSEASYLNEIDSMRNRMKEELGSIALEDNGKMAWMRFDFGGPVVSSYFYSFAQHIGRGYAPQNEDGFVVDETSARGSKFDPSKKLVDTRLFKVTQDNVPVEDMEDLRFRSWWIDNASGVETKKYIDICFHMPSGQFQVSIQDTDKIFTLSHLENKRGESLEAWDFFVGATISILGRKTTIMQPMSNTLKWLKFYHAKFQAIWNKLCEEVRKYERIPKLRVNARLNKAEEGKLNLRSYLEDLKILNLSLSKYRPKVARKIIGDTLSLTFK